MSAERASRSSPEPPEADSASAGSPVTAPHGPPQHFPHLTDRELFERLGWFISIRWFAGAAALLLVLFGWYGFGVHIPPQPVVLTIFVLFLYNALFLLLVTDAYRRERVSRRFIIGNANAQIICDLVTLAALLHLTGGVENYFFIFFICPMVVAGELLSARNAYAHAALGALLIHAVAWSEYHGLLSHVPVGAAIGAETYHSWIAVTKFTVALSLLLFAVVFLESSIASRLRQREEELEDAHDQLRELEQSKSFFMRKTSHELRAPLNAVVTLLQTIETGALGQCDHRIQERLARARQRTVALTRLIEELHRYAMLRDQPGSLPTERVSLADAVVQSVRFYAPMAEDKGLRLRSETEPASVQGNPEAITELVGNLIINAIQYTPEGGRVDVRLHSNETVARLEVCDSGIGIAPEAVDRIFDEFYRAENAKRLFFSGTGMGLPIVRRIVRAHGGTIDVRSAVAHGTTFIVTLPLCATDNALPASPAIPS
ncbi:MAG: HAMP domain-containing histidine kinase [Phycisphaerae bacterium]|nr:HAMP domain-containing histidine kinase [Phycisphaerae bacterium]